jgi:Tfp pilus assembly protein PilF
MKKNILSIRRLALAAVIVAAVSGCASHDKEKTQKEQAVQQWNSARAGIMHNLARDQFQTGNFDKARTTVDEAIKVDPTSAQLYILSARIAMEQNRLDLADKHLAEARKLQPKNAEALYLSGVLSQRWQKHDAALAYYAEALEAQPSELAFLMAKAETLVLLNRRSEALSALQEKVIYFEHSAALRDAVGQLLMQEGRYTEAAEMFRQASILATEDGTLKEHLALARFSAGDFKGCADVLSGLVLQTGYDDRADLFTALGESQLQNDRKVEARISFEKATERNASSTQAWLGLAKAAIALNDLHRAELAARKAVSLSPERADAHLALGFVRLKQERYDDAMRSLKTATVLDANDAVAFCLMGQVMMRQGKPDEALAFYGKALKVNPRDEMAQKLMATAQID